MTPFLSFFFLFTCLGTSFSENSELLNDSPVLVELFTSQGCSSCPPADRVLAKLVNDKQLNVVALSFHVDYWNRLGWKDPYSQAAFSQRQYAYAEQLTKSRRVYTPQIVVHGQRGHIGSREQEVRASIQKAKQSKTNIAFALQVQERQIEQVKLHFEPNSETKAYDLVICMVDASLENEVPRGENRGKALSHVQVVQSMQTLPANEKQLITLDLTSLKNPEQGQIVTFLQHKKNGSIARVKQWSLAAVKIQP